MQFSSLLGCYVMLTNSFLPKFRGDRFASNFSFLQLTKVIGAGKYGCNL